MTAAHTSTSFERRVHHKPVTRPTCLRLRWSVAPSSLGRSARKPSQLELLLNSNGEARVLLDGEPMKPAQSWASTWNGRLTVRRVASGPGKGLRIVEAAPLAVAVLGSLDDERPLHVACDLLKALGLAGGRYELAGGELIS